MIIAEVHENGAQQEKLALTASYGETFWRHGKQLLKGAVVLTAGILGYGIWRHVTRESIATLNDNNALILDMQGASSTTPDNELMPDSTWHNGHKKLANLPPVWINNQIAINQGEKLILGLNNILVNDTSSNDAIYFIVDTVQYGQFEFASQFGTPILYFTAQNISENAVVFVHNNLAVAPGYELTATDGMSLTSQSVANVDFNLRPYIVNNELVIQESGETVLLTNIQILALDNDNLPSELLFTASDVQHGRFQVAIHPDEAATTFFQQDVTNNLVRFIHDGSLEKPSYMLSVSDGRASSETNFATVNFNVETTTKRPIAETAGVSMGITTAGTLVGFAAWRYRNYRDAQKRREESMIADIIREDLNISQAHDFQSDHGAQFIEAINEITQKLELQNIDVMEMTQDEQKVFAHKLAECLKPYVSHKVPSCLLAGDNQVSRMYHYCYYLKVKPIIQSDACWLDTDLIKKEADAIATNVKVKLNEQDQDIEAASNKNNIMMQPLLNH